MDRDILVLMENSILVSELTEIGFAVNKGKKFMTSAIESINTDKANSKLLNSLYRETQKISEVNTINIPASKGDITKFKYYLPMTETLEILESLQGTERGRVIDTAVMLHQAIVNHTNDFTHAYKTNKTFICNFYVMAVMTLYELINASVIETTSVLKNKMTINKSSDPDPSTFIINKQAKNIIKILSDPNWKLMMTHIVKLDGDRIKRAMTTESVNITDATEAEVDASIGPDGVSFSYSGKGPIGAAGGILGKLGNISKFKISDVVSSMGSWLKELSLPVKVIGIIISTLLVTRVLVKYFFRASSYINDFAKTQAAIIKKNIEVNKEAGKDVPKMHRLTLEFLENMSDTISKKILKTERESQKDTKESNKELAIKGNDSEFELI